MNDADPEARHPLPWAQLIALNLALQAVVVGSYAPLFRRGWQEPSLGILRAVSNGLLLDLLLIGALGFVLGIYGHLRGGGPLRFEEIWRNGLVPWHGYALVVIIASLAYNGVLTAFHMKWMGQYPTWLDYLPHQSFAQAPTGLRPSYLTALSLAGLGLALGLALKAKPRLRQSGVWVGLFILATTAIYPAYRQAKARQIVATGDQVATRLRPIRRLAGGQFSPDELSGKLTLVEFFTTWCSSCKRLLPKLQRLDREITDPRFQLFLISRDAADGRGSVVAKLKRYQAKYKPRLPILVDGATAKSWGAQVGITVYPTLALIDGEGRVRVFWSGTPEEGELELAVRQAILEAPSL